MEILISPTFWALVVVVYLLLQLRPPIRTTLWFGLVNSGVLFLLLGAPVGLALYGIAASLWLGIRVAVRIRTRSGKWATAVTAIGATVLIGLFVVNKLSIQDTAFAEAVRQWAPGSGVWVLSSLLALSFSYVALRIADMTRMVLAEGAPLLNPIAMVGYLAPFHMVISGPICPYKEHLTLDSRPANWPTFSRLLRVTSIITTGLFYKLVIAESMRIYATGLHGAFVVESLLDAGYFLIYLYFDFAGYSKVAWGIGQMCGIPTPKNFYTPLCAATVTDFWTRWHASLGTFVRSNLFTPMQLALLRRTRGQRQGAIGLCSLIVSFVFVALWHHVGLSILLWGLVMGLVMAVEKTIRDALLRRPWARHKAVQWGCRLVGPAYVFIVISSGMLIIAKEML